MRVTLLMLTLLVFSCALHPESANHSVEQLAKAYFQTYAARIDFDSFMSFYADDAVLLDVVYEQTVAGKANIARFFDWSRGDFKRVAHGPILTVSKQLVSGNTVVTQGTFNAFVYNQQQLGPWAFIMWHEFDVDGKITHQQDWINYSPKKILLGSADQQ